METEFYGDGQHNGGVFFWGNLNPYIYTYQNPVNFIDPNGKQSYFNSKFDAKGNRYVEFTSQGTDSSKNHITVVNVYDRENKYVTGSVIGADAFKTLQEKYGPHYRKSANDPDSGWDYTKQVAQTAWNSPETQPILLAPFLAILEAGAAGQAFGKISNFEKITGFGASNIEKTNQGIKFIAEGGSEMAGHVYHKLLKEGYKSSLKGSGESAYYELTKRAEKILFRKSKSGG